MKSRHNLSGALTAATGVLGRASNQLIAFAVTLVAARWLSPSTLGTYVLAAALITLSRTLLYAGAFEYLLRARAGEEDFTECLLANLAFAAVLMSLLASGSLLITRFVHSPETATLLLYMMPTCLLAAASAWQESQLLRAGGLRTYYGVTTFAEVVAAVATVTMFIAGVGVLALVGQIYIRAAVLVATYRALRRPSWSDGFSPARAARVVRWSIVRYGATLISFVANYSADFLLGAYLSPAATGLYRVGHRVVTGVSDLVSNPTAMTAVTLFSRRSAAGLDSGWVWPRFAAAAAFLGWTGMAGLAAVADQLTPLVLGPRWAGAGPIIAIICLQRAFSIVTGVSRPLLVAYGRVRPLLTNNALMALTSVVLLAFTARFGVEAAACSTVVVEFASMVSCATIASRYFPRLLAGVPRVLPVAFAPPIAAGAGALAAGMLVRRPDLSPLAILACEVTGGFVAWAIAVFLLRARILDVLQALNLPAALENPGSPAGAGETASAAA